MKKDLYFIPILCRAFGSPDRAEALRRAFAEIEALGRIDEYQVGVRQFRCFMQEACPMPLPRLHLEKDNGVIARIVMEQAMPEVTIAGITPGNYSLRLDTGRLLWAGAFERTDICWAEAFPTAPLRLAADSHEAHGPWTRELRLGGLTLRLYPGLEHGALAIRMVS